MNGVQKNIIISVIIALVMLGLCFGAYRRGAADTGNHIGAERRAAEISGVHTELGNEQRANAERLASIVSLTTEASAAIGELRESNRRSGDLLSLLEQEVDILENYINSMQRELAGYRGNGVDNNTGEVSE
jgi:peptidoglycan hydrolase CwlO-like protein